MNEQSLFHQGELVAQTLANEADIAKRNGVVVKQHIIKGALPFIAQQMMAVISSTGDDKQIWTSVLFGEPGFISAPDDQHLLLNTQQIIQQPADPLWRNIEQNPQVGLLIIELSTRRRFRVNGSITQLENGLFEVTVAQAYPNCPKYIQRRQPALSPAALTYTTPDSQFGKSLSSEQLTLVGNSDSFFVGSGVENLNYDASYRGGEPGFVQIINPRQLLIPDYQGNSMFNTLGNFQSNPHAGLVFIDFENNKLLQLTGTSEVLWDQYDGANDTGGTKRYWQFKLISWQETELPTGLQWTFFENSPHNPKPKSIDTLALTVTSVQQKSAKIKLFRLAAKDGGILPAFEPGSHLPVKLELAADKNALRHYSITSSSHDNRFYEIAVQQEQHGRGGSNYLHEQLHINDNLTVKPPVNEFSLVSPGKHHILIAGGIGITPILAMLRKLSEDNESFELHYSVKTHSDLVFKDVIQQLAGAKAHFYITQQDHQRRLQLQSIVRPDNKSEHVYICGPLRMIDAVKDQAHNSAWPQENIHYESFGSAPQASDTEIELRLQKSGKVIIINPQETLLEGLLAADIAVPFECKRGECGMCVTEYVDGTPDHRDVYLSKDEKQHSLCLCVSRANSKSLTLNL